MAAEHANDRGSIAAASPVRGTTTQHHATEGGSANGASPGRRSAATREEMSPQSKRVAHGEIAPSPPAPGRDMTLTELTHAYQSMSAQFALDRNWMKTVEEATTDHATRIDIFSGLMSNVDVRFREVTTTLGDNATKADGELRQHVQAEDALTRTRLDTAEQKLEAALASLDTDLRKHTQEALAGFGDRVHLLEVAASATAYSPGPTGARPQADLATATLQLKLGQLESALQQHTLKVENLLGLATTTAQGTAKLDALALQLEGRTGQLEGRSAQQENHSNQLESGLACLQAALATLQQTASAGDPWAQGRARQQEQQAQQEQPAGFSGGGGPPTGGPPGYPGGGGFPSGGGGGGGGFPSGDGSHQHRSGHHGGGGDRGNDGKQLFSDQVAQSTKWDARDPEAWLQTTVNYLVSRAASVEPLLEWSEQRQKQVIQPQDLAPLSGSEHCPMHEASELSRNLWGYLNLALAGSVQAKVFNQVPRLHGLEAWRRLVVPLRPRSEAKKNALHTAVHAPPKSRDLSVLLEDLGDWEKVVERFERCGGRVDDSDKRTILLKKLPTGVPSNLMSALRLCASYDDMKAELDDQISFLQDYGSVPQSKTQQGAHVAEAEDQDDVGEGVVIYTEDLGDENTQHVLMMAQRNGKKVFFRSRGGQPSRGSAPRGGPAGRPGTPPRTGASGPRQQQGERAPKCGNCGGEHSTFQCTKPLVPLDKRPCFKCNKVGHQSRHCPDNKPGGAHMADLAAAVSHETSVFCGTITMDDGEGRWNVVPGRQRGNQKARLQALLEVKNNRVAIRNPFDALLCSQPAAAADLSSGVRRGDGGSTGATTPE